MRNVPPTPQLQVACVFANICLVGRWPRPPASQTNDELALGYEAYQETDVLHFKNQNTLSSHHKWANLILFHAVLSLLLIVGDAS